MATRKHKAADQRAVRKANEAAINCFPRKQLKNEIAALADSANNLNAAKDESANHSLEIVRLAGTYGKDAREITQDVTTILQDWRDNMAVLAMELAVAGCPFAEVNDGKDGKTAKLTGTGNNVMSIAKGVVDFGITPDDCADDDGKVSYRDVRTEVQALRAARKAAANPDAAALAAIKADAREAAKDLLDVFFATDDGELIAGLAEGLRQTMKDEQEAQKVAAAIEAEAAEDDDAEAAAA